MTTKVPLNQTYQQAKTFDDYPDVKARFDRITEVSKNMKFVRPNGHPKGRVYDDAILLHSVGSLEGKTWEPGTAFSPLSLWRRGQKRFM